jgi:hypothetical protein
MSKTRTITICVPHHKEIRMRNVMFVLVVLGLFTAACGSTPTPPQPLAGTQAADAFLRWQGPSAGGNWYPESTFDCDDGTCRGWMFKNEEVAVSVYGDGLAFAISNDSAATAEAILALSLAYGVPLEVLEDVPDGQDVAESHGWQISKDELDQGFSLVFQGPDGFRPWLR